MPEAWIQPQIDIDLPTEPAGGGPQDPGQAYGQAEVRRLTGATNRQLDEWDRNGTLAPSVQGASGSGSRRLYSFRDIVAIRMLKQLSDIGVSPRHLATAVQTLHALGETDLASTVLVTDGVTVYQCTSDEEIIDLLRGGQGVITVAISNVIAQLHTALAIPADLATKRARRTTKLSVAPGPARNSAAPR